MPRKRSKSNGLTKRQNKEMTNYSNHSHYDPKIHTKTKGGYGFGMKRGTKAVLYENSGVHLASVFGWKVPKELQHIKEEIDKQNGVK
jgi:stress response protein YsnF